MKSTYLINLEKEYPDVARRYVEKLKIINFMDPFTINDNELDFGIDAVPPVFGIDIISYLVLTHSTYTNAQMKAYKSLSAYKYFEAGFVKMGCRKINNFFIMVKHSQKANEKPLNVWVIAQSDGSICTAHCSCMAGNSEACSHVAAVLFAAEYANKIKETSSCTDVKASWPVPAPLKVPVVPVSEMNWGKKATKNVETNYPTLTEHDVTNLLHKVEEAGCVSALMRIVEPFAGNMIEDNTILLNIFDIYKSEMENKNYSEILNYCQQLNFNLSTTECSTIEERTRQQNTSQEWFHQRSGRITGSKFKACCKTSREHPSLTLLKSVCYPTKMTFSTAAITWGLKHESHAIEAYVKTNATKHTNLLVKQVGFVTNPKHIIFGASPDGLVSCDCCESGCLEVKCPYRLQDKSLSINDFTKMKNTCLKLENDQIILDKNHSYFYQIQLQMLVTETTYCDFVIWSPQEIYIQRIYKDDEFLLKNLETASKYHTDIILPELVGKYFTKKEGGGILSTWCVCKGLEDNRPMLQCDNDDCKIQWFHLDCVKLEDVPQGLWLCEDCSIHANV